MEDTYDLDTSILLQANDFFDAYKRCIEARDPVPFDGGLKYRSVNIPGVVNGFFALELYLKSMNPNWKSRDQREKNHLLEKLFMALPSDIQNEISSKANQKLNGWNWDQNFMAVMKEVSNAFVEWRYIYEEKRTKGFYGDRINKYLYFLNVVLPIFKEVATKYVK
jgi:hypothetical protein